MLTWAALLGAWSEFARSALALPAEGEGGRWRSAVASVVALQAVTHALGELHRVAPADRSVAIDRAEVLVRSHASALRSIWAGLPLPGEAGELVEDASAAIARARSAWGAGPGGAGARGDG